MTNQPNLDNLEELRTYVAIVDRGSLAAAAAALGVSPNAVSRRLGALEDRVGRTLIHRTTRRMAVTDEGRRLHERCRRVLSELQEAEEELAGADGRGGTLRVGLHAAIVCPELMVALGELLRDAPRLRVQLHVATHFLDPIAHGYDLSVYAGRPPASSLIAVSLGTLVWQLAAAPAYVARCGRPRTPQQLARHECLRLLRTHPETHWELKEGSGGKARRYEIGGHLEVSSDTALSAALYAGLGIGVRLRSELQSAIRDGALVPILPAWQWASSPLYALLPRGRSKLPSIRELLAVLRRVTSSLA
ncbi:MAG: LysR family transcriptional regulator [Kofleriaceae bacterium]